MGGHFAQGFRAVCWLIYRVCIGCAVYLAAHGANLVKHTGQEEGVAD